MKVPDRHIPILIPLAAVMAGLLLNGGCSKSGTGETRATAPLEVGALTVRVEPVVLSRELPGRVSAFRVAEVRARVDGIVLKRMFEEGSEVKQGQVLFQIDPKPYQVALDGATATLAQAKAAATAARLQEERGRQLVGTRAISQQAYDDALAAREAAEANVLFAEAAVRSAEINLGYAEVTAPIDGRIGSSFVTEGGYVRAATANLLAVIQQLDPVYVDLVQPSDDMLDLKRALEAGLLQRIPPGESATGNAANVGIFLENGVDYAHRGILQFSDVSVNPSTGSVLMRVMVPNPNEDLLPGAFVRARIDDAAILRATLIPQQALSRNSSGAATVWVVSNDQASLRVVKADRTKGDRWIVTEGLSEGDTVIVTNLQRLLEGLNVNPVPWQPAETTNPEPPRL